MPYGGCPALVQAAEIARELQVRITAVAAPPAGLPRLLGPGPDGQRERLAWNRCVEETAVYLDRYGEPGRAAAGDGWATVLGPRPGDHAARLAYDEVVAVLDEGAAASRSPGPVAAELG